MKRRYVARWLGVLALALLAAPALAQAHGGDRIVSRTEGPYRVALDALAVRSGQSVAAIDYTVYLTDARTGAPVDDARVTVIVGGAKPLIAHRRANTYEVVLPKISRLRVRIASPLGAVAFSYVPPGVSYAWPWQQPVVLGGAALALVLYLR